MNIENELKLRLNKSDFLKIYNNHMIVTTKVLKNEYYDTWNNELALGGHTFRQRTKPGKFPYFELKVNNDKNMGYSVCHEYEDYPRKQNGKVFISTKISDQLSKLKLNGPFFSKGTILTERYFVPYNGKLLFNLDKCLILDPIQNRSLEFFELEFEFENPSVLVPFKHYVKKYVKSLITSTENKYQKLLNFINS